MARSDEGVRAGPRRLVEPDDPSQSGMVLEVPSLDLLVTRSDEGVRAGPRRLVEPDDPSQSGMVLEVPSLDLLVTRSDEGVRAGPRRLVEPDDPSQSGMVLEVPSLDLLVTRSDEGVRAGPRRLVEPDDPSQSGMVLEVPSLDLLVTRDVTNQTKARGQLLNPDSFQEPLGDVWSVNTLDRATRTGQSTYTRAIARKIEWPKPKEEPKPSVDDPSNYTSIDDAFSTVLQFMSQTTRQCKRYYRSHKHCDQTPPDTLHCDRFHTPQYTAVQHKNPLQRTEDVHVLVQPGNYAVTTGSWGNQQQQTHVVHVEDGQTVDLDLVI